MLGGSPSVPTDYPPLAPAGPHENRRKIIKLSKLNKKQAESAQQKNVRRQVIPKGSLVTGSASQPTEQGKQGRGCRAPEAGQWRQGNGGRAMDAGQWRQGNGGRAMQAGQWRQGLKGMRGTPVPRTSK